MTVLEVPTAVHRGVDDLPWVDIGDGSLMRVPQVKVSEGLWIVENKFQPGYSVPTHKHTGCVYAFTYSGAWAYRESEFVNRAGSFLYEPAGSVHSLHVMDDNTELTHAAFVIHGANLDLDDEGNVVMVLDAGMILDSYRMLCEAQGLPAPNVITD